MTEAEWLTQDIPSPMLEFAASRFSDRKLRLIGCAYCRLAWKVLTEDGQEAVHVLEQFADGEVDLEVMDCAVGRANESVATCRQHTSWYCAGLAVRNAGQVGSIVGTRHALYVAEEVVNALGLESVGRDDSLEAELEAARRTVVHRVCGIVRDVVGPRLWPSRSVTLNPAWLKWHRKTVPKLAQAIYADRAFEQLPILADALEEAGCAEAVILEHLREPGPHVRGCWALDLLLRKS